MHFGPNHSVPTRTKEKKTHLVAFLSWQIVGDHDHGPAGHSLVCPWINAFRFVVFFSHSLLFITFKHCVGILGPSRFVCYDLSLFPLHLPLVPISMGLLSFRLFSNHLTDSLSLSAPPFFFALFWSFLFFLTARVVSSEPSWRSRKTTHWCHQSSSLPLICTIPMVNAGNCSWRVQGDWSGDRWRRLTMQQIFHSPVYPEGEVCISILVSSFFLNSTLHVASGSCLFSSSNQQNLFLYWVI